MALDQVDVDKPQQKRTLSGEMTFLDHLEALRWHLVRSVVAILVIAIGTFLAKDFVFNVVLFGPRNPDFITYRIFCSISDAICFQPPAFQIITRDLAEKFMVHFKSSFILGFVLSFPYIFWEIWRFIKPALYEKEQKAATGVVFICSLLFLTGVLFGYYIISPFSISFLAGYELGDIQATPTLSSYVNYMAMFTIPIGLVFEMPVVIYFLSRVGIISPGLMKKSRRMAFVVILIIAAIITPTTDAITLLIVTIPLYGLYELSIVVSGRAEKHYLKSNLED